MAWTREETEEAKRLADEGYSAAQIGAQMGKTRNAIIGRMHRAGLWGKDSPHVPTVRKIPAIRRNRRRARPWIPAADAAAQENEPAAVLVEAPVAEERGPCTLMELRSSSCRYPLGEVLEPAKLFCGQERITGSAYCQEHHNLCNTGFRATKSVFNFR